MNGAKKRLGKQHLIDLMKSKRWKLYGHKVEHRALSEVMSSDQSIETAVWFGDYVYEKFNQEKRKRSLLKIKTWRNTPKSHNVHVVV